jgi:hypothetical protein
MTRDQLREQINTMEALDGVMRAISDVSGMEFEPGEPAEINIEFFDRSPRNTPVGFAQAIPHDVALAGLRAMQQALEQMLSKETA